LRGQDNPDAERVRRKGPRKRGGFDMSKRVFRVLCIDGGGMRGIYTAAYIAGLAQRFAAQRKVPGLDFGKAFNLSWVQAPGR
jgi:hypothetical protein